MRTLPGESAQLRLQVADVSRLAIGVLQVADPEEVVPSANFSDDSEPVLLMALFQFAASLTPADSLAAIATVPVTPESLGGIPPTKSMLMIIGVTPASATVPPVVLVPPTRRCPAGSTHRRGSASSAHRCSARRNATDRDTTSRTTIRSVQASDD